MNTIKFSKTLGQVEILNQDATIKQLKLLLQAKLKN